MIPSNISIILNVLFLCSQYVSAQINFTEYYQMPPMYEFEDYVRCLHGQSHPEKEGTYCVTRTIIQPNKSASIWNITHKYASDRKHFFRHDNIVRGICMDRCIAQMLRYDYDTRMKYYLPKFSNELDVVYDPDLFSNGLVDHTKFNRFATMCINYDLQKKYGLMAQTDVVYCQRSFDSAKYDIYDILFAVLCVSLLAIIVMSTLYDFYLKRQNLPHMCNREHYKRPVDRGLNSALVSFSIARNWYKLTSDLGPNSELSRDLRSINGLRCLFMVGVVSCHAFLPFGMLPVANPEFLEEQQLNPITGIAVNIINALQMFFAITGYLIAVSFMDLRKKLQFDVSHFWKTIINRYIRFAPAYLFMLFFHSTWLFHSQSGPFWQLFEIERNICRKNWWTNVLYVNNFVSAHEPCMQHAWYLAADFQLVIVGAFIQMVLWRFPRFTKAILGSCLALSFIIPSVVAYVNKFDGIFKATLDDVRYLLRHYPMYHAIHIPSYMSFGSFLIGMIGGYLYCLHKQGHIDLLRTRFFAILWWCMIPILFLALSSGYVIYANDFEKPSLWIAIYSALIKNIWGLNCAMFVTGIALNTGSIIKRFFRMPIFRTMSRLTFGAYLIHPCVLLILTGYHRQPLFATYTIMTTLTVSAYFISYFLSFIMCMCIELPFSVLQKQLFSQESKAPTESIQTVYQNSETDFGKLSKNLSDNLELVNNNNQNHLGNKI